MLQFLWKTAQGNREIAIKLEMNFSSSCRPANIFKSFDCLEVWLLVTRKSTRKSNPEDSLQHCLFQAGKNCSHQLHMIK